MSLVKFHSHLKFLQDYKFLSIGDIVGHDSDTTFTPELASTFTNLFTTIFQRRLGTKTDGTSLSASPKVGLKDLDEDRVEKRSHTYKYSISSFWFNKSDNKCVRVNTRLDF